jgi:DNA-binding response OmpR family regulator
MIIEDDSWIRAFVKDALLDEGYAVIEAADGQTALRLVDDHAPDLVLLDLALAGTSGIEVLRHLRYRRHARGLPVIVLSAFTRILSPDVAASVALVLSKPFEVEALLGAVRRIISDSGTMECDERSADDGDCLVGAGPGRTR